MSERALSRRSLLLAGAGTLAGVALHPAGALAALGGPPGIGTLALGNPRAGVRTLELPPGVALVGLQWRGPGDAAPRLRVRLAGGWGPWVAAGGHGHLPDRSTGELSTGEPLWIGGARLVQIATAGPLAEARLRLVRGSGGARGAREAAAPLATPLLQAGPGQPPIIARRFWAVGIQPPRVAPEYGEVLLGFVHHTENPNGYSAAAVPAMLRAIYAFHRNVNGWNDIGYNFVIDSFGRIFEARAGGIDEPVTGAHAGGYNYVSTGIAILGSFSGAAPTAAARAALQRLLAWKLSLHGVPPGGRVTVRVNPAGAVYSKYPARARVALPRISGHRDADSTECPGNVLYGELPAVRRRVRSLAGDPVTALLSYVPAVPAVAEAPGVAGAAEVPAALSLTLRTVSGLPVGGAPVLLQARTVARRGLEVSETTLAEARTDASGACTVPVAFAAGATAAFAVRALFAGEGSFGAAVSRAVSVPPQPALTPPPATAPSG